MANITKLPSGSYRARVFLGKDENGKQHFRSFTAPKLWQVEKAVEEFLEKGGGKSKRKALTMTVGQAVDSYIELKRNVLAPSTLCGYEVIRRTRLQSIMSLPVDKLDTLTMQRAVNEDAKRLSAKSLKEAKCLILASLRLFGLKPDIELTLPPKVNRIKTLPTAREVFEIIRGTPSELPCLLSMWLSLRMSEVRGLKFKDVQNGVLLVQRANVFCRGCDNLREINKTDNSTRALALPEHIKLLIGDIPHTSDDEFIIKDSYKDIYKQFKRLMSSNGIDMRFHDLRHLNASIMLMLGIPDKYAMERGGWKTTAVLKSVYQHTFSEERKLADQRIDSYFNSIIDTPIDTAP